MLSALYVLVFYFLLPVFPAYIGCRHLWNLPHAQTHGRHVGPGGLGCLGRGSMTSHPGATTGPRHAPFWLLLSSPYDRRLQQVLRDPPSSDTLRQRVSSCRLTACWGGPSSSPVLTASVLSHPCGEPSSGSSWEQQGIDVSGSLCGPSSPYTGLWLFVC